MQRGLNYRISTCNFIADWMIVVGTISVVGLALATSLLATTDLLEHSHQPGPDLVFQNFCLGRNVSFKDLTNIIGFQSGLFFTTMRLRTQLSANHENV